MIVIDWKSIKKKLTKDKTDRPPMGMRVYKGPQGHGKTLSMVHDAIKLIESYPKMFVVSNVALPISDRIVRNTDEILEALKYDNGENGILFIIDEVQLFASKKKGVGFEIFQGLCQQRKHRRFMMGTAQDWEDIDPSARKKVKTVVDCRRIGNIQINRIFDGYSIKYDKTAGEWACRQTGIEVFKHNDELYSSYDTYAEISTNAEMVERVDVRSLMK